MTNQPDTAEIRHAQRPAIIEFAPPAPDDAEQIAAGLHLTGVLVVDCIRKLNDMAARSKRSDGELVAAATSYPDPDVQNAAVALFHARTGQLTPDKITEEHLAAVEFMEALAS